MITSRRPRDRGGVQMDAGVQSAVVVTRARALSSAGVTSRVPRLLTMVVTGLLAMSAARAALAESGRIEAIKASESADGASQVTIAVSKRPTFTTWKLERPARVIIDISGAKLGEVEVPFDAGTFALGTVAASASQGEGGARTRVVLTLRRPSDYDVETAGNTINLKLRPHQRPATAPAVAAASSAPPSPSVDPHRKATEAAQAAAEKARAAALVLASKLERERGNTAAARASADRMREEAEARAVEAEAAKKEAEEAARRVAEQRRALDERQRQAEAAEKAAKEAAATLQAERAAAAAKLAEERKAADKAAAESQKRIQAEQALAEKARQEALKAQQQAQKEREAAEASLAKAEAAEERAEKRAAERARKISDKTSADKAARDESVAAELASAQREVVEARQAAKAAAAEAERLAGERKRLEAVRAELDGREKDLVKAQAEASKAHQAAEALGKRALEARDREAKSESAAGAAAAELEDSKADLEVKQTAQKDQQRKLAQAEKLVAERDREVRRAAEKVAAREKAADEASRRLEALAKQVGASRKAKEEARAEVARAQADRKEALAEARQTREELDEAKQARKREEDRRVKLERERKAEEARLAVAGKRRAAEEARLAKAAEARRKEESRAAEALASRSKLDSERGRLEAERTNLVGEIARLRQTVKTAGKQASRALARAEAGPAPTLATVAAPPADEAPSLPAAAPEPYRAPPVPAPAARPMSVTLRAPSRIQRIDFVDEPSHSTVIIDLDELSRYAVLRTGAGRLTLRLERAELAPGLERSMDATEYLGPVKLISSYRDPGQRGAVRIDVDMAEDVPTTVRQEGTRLFWSFRKSPTSARAEEPATDAFVANLQMPRKIAGFSTAGMLAPLLAQGPAPGASQTMRPSAGGKRRYTGRRIDLDFKGADIHNILRLLADVGGVNIVTSDDVKGEVTIKMRDVPWDQALDVVLRQKQLGQVREGNLIRVAPLQVLEKELEQEIARQKQITEVLPTETRLIGVSYADAKSLTDRAKDLLSPRGKVSVDERTNTLIVSDVGRNLGLIEELVRNLDTQTSQVIIEARIVEARSTFVRQIGVQWGGSGFADTGHGNPTGLVFPHNVGIGGGATDGNTPTEGLVPGPRSGTGAASPNFAVNMPAAVGTGAGGALGLTLGSVAGAFNLNLRLSAMESTGQVRILSSPRISTLDNHEASIEQGVSIPISVVSAQGVQTVFVDARLALVVKPHVTNDGTVMMDIRVTRNEPDFVNTGARGDPTILKKEANTMMLVRDGDTAVIGGIYQRNSGLNYSKVPFFADIPVLGILFRAKRENDDRTEFLVFITPRIANRARALGN